MIRIENTCGIEGKLFMLSDDQTFSGLTNALPEDQAAWRFVKSWHQHPLMSEVLLWRGVNLGALFEYHLVEGVMEVFAGHQDREAP